MTREDPESYVRAFPKLEKWINTCRACGLRGYDASMPEHIFGPNSYHDKFVRKKFEPLALDANGLCPQCSEMFTEKPETY